jgi:hypothetical protein
MHEVMQKVFGDSIGRKTNFKELCEIAKRGIELGFLHPPKKDFIGTPLEKLLQKFLAGHKNTFTVKTFAAFLRENDYESKQINVLKFLHGQADKNNIVCMGKTSHGTVHELAFQGKAT